MLPSKKRLPAVEFKKRFQKSVVSPYFLLRYKPNNTGCNRLGVIISAKVDKRSVRRNYLKRRFREYFGHLSAGGTDFLIIASPMAGQVGFVEIKKELDRLTEGLKIRN